MIVVLIENQVISCDYVDEADLSSRLHTLFQVANKKSFDPRFSLFSKRCTVGKFLSEIYTV